MQHEHCAALNRRHFTKLGFGLAAALLVSADPLLAQAESNDPLRQFVDDDGAPATVTRRVSGLQTRNWQEYFPSLTRDAILCDTRDRVLHYWGEGGFYRIYPTSVPLSDELTRRGRTEIVLKRPDPEWRPTESMLERNPDLPRYVPPGPDNPLGTHALNLSWQYYRIHGTNDIRKIGRQSSNGCVGMFNEHIREIYDRAQVGTQVLLV